MKKGLVILAAFFILTSFNSAFHDTYLSVTEIEYKQEQESLQIVSRVFIDDFENVLSKRYQSEVSLSYKEDLKKNKQLISRYINQKLNINIDGEKRSLKLLGSKFDADQIVLFIEAKNINSFNRVKVENLLLTDMFDDQKNIVHVKYGDKIESMLLVKNKGSKEVKF
ncbi:DUF6702 family protein [Christiangramia salexigens]|uniref:Peptidase E n=1 Tax=Christiangramia salexigens TaxID=1913577 RepID=A0A1L3J7Z4_9FLAO|nr:DUF6702 family protein [Christiangramia salexigens]APG61256.1 hypothetical protein LPB144_12950 [Christiangramia salexigens]